MHVFGDKNTFAMAVGKDEYAYQLELYIEGNDILMFTKEGGTYRHRWNSFDDIMEWFEDNLASILKYDEFPLAIPGNSAAELEKNSYEEDYDIDDKPLIEALYNWSNTHSWLAQREGAVLADVFFRRVQDKIEISWDTVDLFINDGFEYLYPKGVYFVEPETFEEVVLNVVQAYKRLKNNL